MADMYAWSPIHYHKDDKGGRQIAKAGSKVTQEQLGVDDAGWKEMVEAGSIRSTPWPEGLDAGNPNGLSPNEHRLQSLRNEREKLEAEMAGVGNTDDVTSDSSSGSNVSVPSGAPTKESEANKP